MEDIVKIGRVSAINYNTGMIQVLYEDLSDEDDVSDYMPFLNFNREYFPPAIGEMVAVFGMSNGTAMGVVGGGFWNEGNPPPESGANIYRKDFSKNIGEAFLKFAEGKLLLRAKDIIFQTENGEISAEELLKKAGES